MQDQEIQFQILKHNLFYNKVLMFARIFPLQELKKSIRKIDLMWRKEWDSNPR